MQSGTKSPLAWFLLIVLSVIWGSSFILMHEGLKAYSSTQLAAYRICIAGILFLPFGIANLFKVEKSDIKWFALSGLMGNFIPAFCFAYAQTYLQSSTAGALNALTPFFTLIAGIFLFSKIFNKYKIIGIVIGLIGALTLIIAKPGGGIETNYEYGIIIIISTLFYGTNVNVIESKLSKYSPMYIASIPLSLIFIPGLICLILFNFPFSSALSSPYIKSTLSISALGLLGTGLSLVLFNRLIQITNGLFASTVTYMMPVVSTLWGLYYHESIGLIQIMALCLILLGILVVRKFN
ncbi:MAG: DMT family transporter [Bacteroidia bacterium]